MAGHCCRHAGEVTEQRSQTVGTASPGVVQALGLIGRWVQLSVRSSLFIEFYTTNNIITQPCVAFGVKVGREGIYPTTDSTITEVYNKQPLTSGSESVLFQDRAIEDLNWIDTSPLEGGLCTRSNIRFYAILRIRNKK